MTQGETRLDWTGPDCVPLHTSYLRGDDDVGAPPLGRVLLAQLAHGLAHDALRLAHWVAICLGIVEQVHSIVAGQQKTFLSHGNALFVRQVLLGTKGGPKS